MVKKLKFTFRKGFKILLFCLFVYVFLLIITPFNSFLRNRSISNQINYLSGILDEGYDDELQNRFPEGKIFSNALLALSIIEHSSKPGISAEISSSRIDHCINRLISSEAEDHFTKDMDPSYGMFYNSWTLLVLSEYEKSPIFEHSSIKSIVKSQRSLIEDRLKGAQKNQVRILDTYRGAKWPADNLVGVIAMNDIELKRQWTNTIIESSQHKSGLISHSGSAKSIVRGSSSALITYALHKIGYQEIQEYNNRYNGLLVDEYMGVQLVKENENGKGGSDIDSGPVVFGYGASATIMNIKTQASLGFKPKAKNTWALMNLVGIPINCFGKKYFIFKKEPMFDLFMLWSGVEL